MSKKSSSFVRNLKRNRKASYNSLKVESLESRQLMAVVQGGGTEVLSDVHHPNGLVYDQVLMTGPSVTVAVDHTAGPDGVLGTADDGLANQFVRVSFLDTNGDIVQVEFAGHGNLNISLAGATANVTPTSYLPQSLHGQAITYEQGLATITITDSAADTNVSIFTVGNNPNNAYRNVAVFDATHTGGDHFADISHILLVGNTNNAAGYTNFGSINAGDVHFSDTTGVVGIRGENVAVQGTVSIGDIDAKESGVPTLFFNSNSQFQTVFVRGGDLHQTNGVSFDSFGNGNPGAPGGSPGQGGQTLGGFAFFNSTNGTDSAGNLIWANPVNQDAIRLAAVDQQTLMAGDWVINMTDTTHVTVTQNGTEVTAFDGDWSTQGLQNALDHMFSRRTFQGNITVQGDMPAGYEIDMASARGNVTFANNMFGHLVVNGYGAQIAGTLTVLGNLDGSVLVQGFDRVNGTGDGQQNDIHALVVGGSTGPFADIRAEDIGSVSITHNFSGILSTNVGAAGRAPDTNNTWSGTLTTGTGYVDVDGWIGNVTIGYNADGTSNGGSIINATIQGMSNSLNSGLAIGNVKVGGDIWGSPLGTGVFVTSSNPGAAPTDVRNYGSGNIGTINVAGDVDLDQSDMRFIHIAGNGTFGNINVLGQVQNVSNTVTTYKPGPDVVDKTVPLANVRFIDFFNPSFGNTTYQNIDPDGVPGPKSSDYIIGDPLPTTLTLDGVSYNVSASALANDVGKAIGSTGYIYRASYTNPVDGTHVILDHTAVTQAGDRIVVLNAIDGTPKLDVLHNPVFVNYAVTADAHMIPGPDVIDTVTTTTTVMAGNRGTLDGVANNFGRIEISHHLGAQQPTTGAINWTDSVDMDFGGITVNSAGDQNQGVISEGTIGQITITNTGWGVAHIYDSAGSDGKGANAGKLYYDYATYNPAGVLTPTALVGKGSDITLSGRIGDPQLFPETVTPNIHVAMIGLAGLTVSGAEHITLHGEQTDNSGNEDETIIAVDRVTTSINLSTIAGSGDFLTGISPVIHVDDLIVLNNGTSEATQKLAVSLNTGMVNSSIIFTDQAGIIVTDGISTGNTSELAALTLAADYVAFDGILQAQKIDGLTLAGGTGLGSTSDTSVDFEGQILGNVIGNIGITSTQGNVIFAPWALQPVPGSQLLVSQVGTTTIDTSGSNNGGDITLGALTMGVDQTTGEVGATSGLYMANFGDITLKAGHKLFLDQSGTIIDNPGNVWLNFGTTGNVGNIAITTTTGNINNNLWIQGNVGNITYTAGYAVAQGSDLYAGAAGDLLKFGSIGVDETIYGTRGVTTLTTAGQKADGSADPVSFTAGGVAYSLIPAGSVTGTLRYAGASTATGDSLVVRTGLGDAVLDLYVIGNDDNKNGLIESSELGHGGSVNIRSVAGNIDFEAFTPTPGQAANILTHAGAKFEDYIHFTTMGNVMLATGAVNAANGALLQSGNITTGFNSAKSAAFDINGAPVTIGGVDALPVDHWAVTSDTTGFEGKVGTITATTVAGAGNITFLPSRFDNDVKDITLTGGTFTDGTGAIFAGNILIGGGSLIVATQAGSGGSGGGMGQSGGVIFNANRGVFTATTQDLGWIDAAITVNAPTTVTGNAFVFQSKWAPIDFNLMVGSYDANNNALITANEYARSGNISVSSEGGDISLQLTDSLLVGLPFGPAYTSATEQAMVGNIVLTNHAPVLQMLGAIDQVGNVTPGIAGQTVGAGRTTYSNGVPLTNSNGNITIIGGIPGITKHVSAVGTITATIADPGNVNGAEGNINMFGTFGDTGTTTLLGSSYFDPDYIPNKTDEAPLFQKASNISLGGVESTTYLEIDGLHGLVTATTVDNGNITGEIYVGGSPTAANGDGFKFNTTFGNIDVLLFATVFDRNGNGAIQTNADAKLNEYGNTGNIIATSVAGNILLVLGTDVGLTAGMVTDLTKQNSIPNLKFGNVTVTTGDSYDTGVGESIATNFYTDGKLRPYLAGNVSATVNDTPAAIGNVLIVGAGFDPTNPFALYGAQLAGSAGARVAQVSGNRGTVGIITENVTRGNAALMGTFNNVGDVFITAGTYVDAITNGPNAFAGSILFGGDGTESGGMFLTIEGTHGTATLTTANNLEGGTLGAPAGGGISGNVFYGGTLAKGETNSIVANTQSSNIDINVTAAWYDIDGNGLITDLNNQVVQGTPIDEFAHVGNIILHSNAKDGPNSMAGNVTVGLAVGTAGVNGLGVPVNPSKIGSSIGNIDLATRTVVNSVVANANDTFNNGNIIITGLSALPLLAGTLGDIKADLGATGAGTITMAGNFINIGALTFTTGKYTDASVAGGGTAVLAAGNISLGNPAVTVADTDLTGVNFPDTLNIAGTYKDSTFTVQSTGTIMGSIFIAGSIGSPHTWSFKSDAGAINVKMAAGFDINGAAPGGDQAGEIGNVTAQSNTGLVTLGLTAPFAGSKIGNGTATTNSNNVFVTLSTGDADAHLGNILATTTDPAVTVKAGALDTVVSSNVTITGVANSATHNAFLGTIGTITGTVQSGVVTLQGDFPTVGDILLQATKAYVDRDTGVASQVNLWRSGDVVVNAQIGGTHGNVTLSAGDTTMAGLTAAEKIAAGGTTVTGDLGTVSGMLSFAGSTAGAATKVQADTEKGNINLVLLAGFDTDFVPNGISASEAGSVGNVQVYTHDGGDVILGLNTARSNSLIGNVDAKGLVDIIDMKDGGTAPAAATLVDAGNVTVTGASIAGGHLYDLGTAGTIGINVGVGAGTLQGDFGNVGAITMRSGAAIDTDTTAATTVAQDEAIVALAGTLNLGTVGTALRLGGTFGAIDVKTVDSSLLLLQFPGLDAAGNQLDALSRVAAMGNVTTNLFVAGSSAAGVTITTDFGSVTGSLAAGYNYDNATAADGAIQTAEAGNLGPVTVLSRTGDITLQLGAFDPASLIGDVKLTTHSIYKIVAGGLDTTTAAQTGTISLSGAAANLGKVGNITANSQTGDILFYGTFGGFSTVNLNTVGYPDLDPSAASPEDPSVLATGDVRLTDGAGTFLTVLGNHGTLNITTVDDATNGRAAAVDAGNVMGKVTFFGALTGAASGNGVVVNTQQGDVNTLTVEAKTGVHTGAGEDFPVNNTTTNTDDLVGQAGNFVVTSAFGDISVVLNTDAPVAKGTAAGDVVRTPSIGGVTLTTSSSWTTVGTTAIPANDIPVVGNQGAITIAGNSQGSLAAGATIQARTLNGNIIFGGTYDNTVGNIDLAASAVLDITSPVTPNGYLAAGSVTFGGTFASRLATTVGTIALATAGKIDDAGLGASGSILANPLLGAFTFSSGAITATAVDGTINFSPTSGAGFVASLANVTLRANGTSAFAGTGDIGIGAGGTFSNVAGLDAKTASGSVTLSGNYVAPQIGNVSLWSVTGGNVTLSGELGIGFANVAANQAVSGAITSVTLEADNGNVLLSGIVGSDATLVTALGGLAQIAVAAGASDPRTFTIGTVTLQASDANITDVTVLGNVSVTGRIGGTEVTNITTVNFHAQELSASTVTLNSAAGNNVLAHKMGTLEFWGNTTFVNAGPTNILADDGQSVRNYIGAANYSVASAGNVAGKGSNLDTISTIAFHGPVIGGANSLSNSAFNAEIAASAITNFIIDAKIDPTWSQNFAAQDLDVLVSNVRTAAQALVPQERIALNSTVASVTPLSAYQIGTLSINHNLQIGSPGTAVFNGTNVFSSIGGMGNLTITAAQAGQVQAPMFLAGSSGNAIFQFGDGNADVLNSAGTGLFTGVADGAAAGFTNMPAGKVSVGDVRVNVGSSYVPPATQKSDIGNAGGGPTGAGFVIAVAAISNFTPNLAFTPPAGLVDSTRGLYGFIKSIEIRNNAIRPDNFNINDPYSINPTVPGIIVVAGDSAAAGSAVDVGDVLNEEDGGAIRPLVNVADQYVVGSDADTVTAGFQADQNDVLIYVL